MKLILLLVVLVLIAGWCLWHASLARLWRWLGARPMAHFPVWRQVKERMAEIARRERQPLPVLWILPDFSPNAIVLRSGGRLHVAMSEGLLRSLESEELDAVLGLCFYHGALRNGLQTFLALQLFPFARWLQGYPPAVQVFLSPLLTVIFRLVSSPSRVLVADRKGSEKRAVAAALQKIAILGRKIPFRHWNFALDPLFLVSPLAIDGGPFWVFLSQPSIEERRQALLS